jgi:branched-chain amino acid transport system ATP-binding protein
MLSARDLGIDFGGVQAVDGVSFTAERGEIFAIIGPNGAGKTTLFNLVSGIYTPKRGSVALDGEDVTGKPPHLLARRGLSRTFQNLQVFFRMTAAENVMVGRHLHENRNVLAHLLMLPAVTRQNRATRAKAEELLALVGLAGIADRAAGTLPYGALKRLEIAAGGAAVVLVEHDMRLVMKISNRIHVLDQGRTLAEGTASEVRANPAVVAAYLGAQGGRAAGRGEIEHARG